MLNSSDGGRSRMGVQIESTNADSEALRAFMKRLLGDVRALETMLESGVIESGIRRIGAEQEMFLVDRAMRPAPVNLAVLEHLDDRFTTELGRFNIEANLPPLVMGGDCLSRLEKELNSVLATARKAAKKERADVLLCGVAPTLKLSDMTLENMTPFPRYRALNDALMALRGDSYQFFVKGSDEVRVSHDSVMLEACNTSFQVHFQVGPDEFAKLYNIAQVATGPVLASAVNSPVLFGKELWCETRIALFEQAVDTRRAAHSLRDVQSRVGFGHEWIDDSVLEIFRDDIMRFRVILADAAEEDPFELLAKGKAPKLPALCLHNSTVYRWNRACYGVLDGKPHLRIENRVLPSGPTPHDEVANAAFWFGLLGGIIGSGVEVRDQISFSATRRNFLNASQHGLNAQVTWLDGKTRPARDLIRKVLLPLAREGLVASGIDENDVDLYLGTIEARTKTGRTGAFWMLESLSNMKEEASSVERMRALSSAMLQRQKDGAPVHKWKLAKTSEVGGWAQNFLTVDQFMTTDLITVHTDELVDLCASLMRWKRIAQVPVEDDDQKLVGIVSVSEVLQLVERGLPEGEGVTVPVSTIMDRSPLTAPPETPTLEAIRLMREHHARCLLITRGDELVGLVTERDLGNIAGQLLTEKLEAEGK